MIYQNSQICATLNISAQSLKKIRSLLVNRFHRLKRREKIDSENFELIRSAVSYVANNPGASYETGIEKAISSANFVNSFLSPEEQEEQKNFDALDQHFPTLWGNYILMTAALSDLAKKKNLAHIATLLNACVDTVATELGRALREE